MPSLTRNHLPEQPAFETHRRFRDARMRDDATGHLGEGGLGEFVYFLIDRVQSDEGVRSCFLPPPAKSATARQLGLSFSRVSRLIAGAEEAKDKG